MTMTSSTTAAKVRMFLGGIALKPVLVFALYVLPQSYLLLRMVNLLILTGQQRLCLKV